MRVLLSRRSILLGAMAGTGVALVGCATPRTDGTSTAGTTTSAQPSVSPAAQAELAELAALESTFGGRIGVYAIDTGTGATVAHRADERFLMCSTSKVLATAAVLRLRAQRPGLLDEVIRYDQSQVLEYAPATSQHVADGMTVSALCEAAITLSDNTAANLLVQTVGGPREVTAFARTLGDRVTSQDRIEPDLNVGAPGDERDTSTPAQMAADLRALALGDGLDPAGRDLLVGWLKANTTGGKSIRAGLPDGWVVGDKTGSGAQGEVDDIAVAWPPGRAPLVIAVYTAPADPKSQAGRATVAGAAAIVAKALTG
jgi:beta-lactamase class A